MQDSYLGRLTSYLDANEPTTPKNNQLLKMLLILAIVFSPFLSFSQETVEGMEVDGDRKNSIKGMPYVVGNFFMGGYAGISAGYERQIGKKDLFFKERNLVSGNGYRSLL